MPRMRLMVWPASMVCSVLSTRWPVSAALRAISTVSRSRISPTRMTLGAWRRAARRPLAKRVEIRAQLALVEGGLLLRVDEFDRILEGDDVNGLGLVDLVRGARPAWWICREPVAPVTSTRPVFSLATVVEDGGQLQLGQASGSRVELAQHDRVVAALREDVHAEARPCPSA